MKLECPKPTGCSKGILKPIVPAASVRPDAQSSNELGNCPNVHGSLLGVSGPLSCWLLGFWSVGTEDFERDPLEAES